MHSYLRTIPEYSLQSGGGWFLVLAVILGVEVSGPLESVEDQDSGWRQVVLGHDAFIDDGGVRPNGRRKCPALVKCKAQACRDLLK